MTIVLGAANAYLGLRAGITIAATYPAAVIAMAAMRAWKGSLLEENIARTAGSIGESVAAGAIFTLPAFLLAKAWPSFRSADAYWKSTALIMVGSILGVLFISLVRRGMVEDPELPFPESLAASEIHKAGQRGAQAAKYLFWNIGVGGVVYILGKFGLFAADTDLHFGVGSLGHSQVRLGTAGSTHVVATGGTTRVRRAERESGLSRRRLHHRRQAGVDPVCRQRAGLGTAGSLADLFSRTATQAYIPADTPDNWATMADAVWRYIVRPIAVGGMLVGAAYTLFKMRASLTAGIGKAFADLRQTADQQAKLARTERYMSSKTVFGLIAGMFVLMCLLYIKISGLFWPAILAAVVMILVGFFFATVSGNLVGFIGSSNNPISGLTLSTSADRGAADGGAGSFRHLGSSRGSGSSGGGLRFVGGSRRTAAGLQSRLHSRRHAAEDSDRGTDRRRGGQPGDVFPADAAARRQHQSRRRRLWRTGASRAAGGSDGNLGHGHRGPRYALAAGGGGNFVRHRDDHDAGEESHAGGGRHVSCRSEPPSPFLSAECFARSETGSPSAADSTALRKRAWRMPECWSLPD